MAKYGENDLIDINKKKGLPRTYRFNRFIRFVTIILALFAIVYAVWYVFSGVTQDSSTFRKIVPFVIIFFAFNSLFRNLFSVNSIIFSNDGIAFRYMGKGTLFIEWDNILKLSVYSGKTRAVQLEYLNRAGDNKTFVFTMNFPNLLEIINSIAELANNAEYDEFMSNVIVGKKAEEK